MSHLCFFRGNSCIALTDASGPITSLRGLHLSRVYRVPQTRAWHGATEKLEAFGRMSLIVYFMLVATAVVGCYGNTFKMGACPRVTVKDNVDFDRFLGEWHVVKRFNPMATCTKINLEKTPEGVYTVNETSRPLGLRFGYHHQYMKARELKFLRNDTSSIFRIERNLAHFTLSTFGIVDTDYDNYALVWGCDPVLFGSVQNVDIWARQPRPEPDTIKPAKEQLRNLGVDFHPLDNVDQSHCVTEESGSEGSTSGDTNNMVAG